MKLFVAKRGFEPLNALWIPYVNSLDSDLARQNFGPDLDPNCLTLMVFLKDIFENVDFEKNQHMAKKHAKFPRSIG